MRRWVLAAVMGLGGCAGASLFTDGSSVSVGTTNKGRMRQPGRLPLRGPGFVVPDKWRSRKFQYGTDELVAAVQRAAERVHAADRRSRAGFADLSRNRGGPSIWHNSHHAGRDVDVLFYSVDERGKPMAPPERDMIAYGGDGLPHLAAGQTTPYAEATWEGRRFDDRRNWQFLEALIADPTIRLQWVFVSNELEARLLAYARRKKRPEWIVEYARVVMNQPGDSLPHDNHFHIRVYCSRGDRFHGCVDRGPIWQHDKKSFKYGGPEQYDPVLVRRLGLDGSAIPRLGG